MMSCVENVVGSDISQVAIDTLSRQAAQVEARSDTSIQRARLSFVVDDCTKSKMADESFELIVDKGCLDAVLTAGAGCATAAVNEYTRLTSSNGCVLLVTGGDVADRFRLFSQASPLWCLERLHTKASPQSKFSIMLLRKSRGHAARVWPQASASAAH